MGMKHDEVSRARWLEARRELLVEEKRFTKLRDQLSEQRRRLPWVRIEEGYTFDTDGGEKTLAELFDGRSQLVVYHFMFAADWEAGCKSCSFWADNFDRNVVHLARRDVTLIAVSTAPRAKLSAYAERMGWTFTWVSSGGTRFNHDFGVTFGDDDVVAGEVDYNFAKQKAGSPELPGISVFYRDDDGAVFHTYSCYARGLDMLNAGYHYLDLVPKGRDEDAGIMTWLRRRDEYDA